MIVTASGLGLALEAVFASARLFSSDDVAAPTDDRTPWDKAAGSDAGTSDPDPDLEAFWRGDEARSKPYIGLTRGGCSAPPALRSAPRRPSRWCTRSLLS